MYLTYDAHKKAEQIYEKIKKHYGTSKFYKNVPKLMLLYEPNFKKVRWGFFWSGEIGINFCKCTSWKQVICAMIHEYWHYHQHPGWYVRYEKKYGYKNNPYEIQANEVAERDWRLFE